MPRIRAVTILGMVMVLLLGVGSSIAPATLAQAHRITIEPDCGAPTRGPIDIRIDVDLDPGLVYLLAPTPSPAPPVIGRDDGFAFLATAGSLTMTIRGEGFGPGEEPVLFFATEDLAEQTRLGSGLVDDRGMFELVVPVVTPARRGTYVVYAAVSNFDGGLSEPVARAAFTVPCPPEPTPTTEPARPTPTPTPRPEVSVQVRPDCGRPALQGEPEGRRQRVRITGSGFLPGPVSIVVDADGLVEPERFERQAGRDGAVDEEIDLAPRPAGTYRVVVVQEPPVGAARAPESGRSAEATFRSPCRDREPPAPTIDPVCGDVPTPDGTFDIIVRGTGFYPDASVFLSLGGDPEATEFVTDSDGDGSFEARIRPRERGPRERPYPVRAVQRDSIGQVLARAQAGFSVPCPIDPAIAITPGSGPTGYTARVQGSGFRPGTSVLLSWDQGLEASRPTQVEVSADGTFETYIYILPNDLLGSRTLTAGLPGDADAFPGVSDTYTVVPGPGVPPQAGPGGYVFRR